jgi:hypothetical protein
LALEALLLQQPQTQLAQVALIPCLVLLHLLVAVAVHQQGTTVLLAHQVALAVAVALISILILAQAQQTKVTLAVQKVLVDILPLVVVAQQV